MRQAPAVSVRRFGKSASLAAALSLTAAALTVSAPAAHADECGLHAGTVGCWINVNGEKLRIEMEDGPPFRVRGRYQGNLQIHLDSTNDPNSGKWTGPHAKSVMVTSWLPNNGLWWRTCAKLAEGQYACTTWFGGKKS